MNSNRLDPETDPLYVNQLAAFDEALALGNNESLNDSSIRAEDAALLRLLDMCRPRLDEGPLPLASDSPSRYTLKSLHAAGGVGQVWIAHDADLNRDVALKVLHAERTFDPKQQADFLHEARITGKLQHPGITPVYELVSTPSDDQTPFYTMRLVPGRTLKDAIESMHIRKRGVHRVERTRLLNAFIRVAETVAFAHTQRVIHRDLKPQNVALGEFGEVVVLDWGFAAELGSPGSDQDGHDTTRGIAPKLPVVGTPEYMSPEQASGLAASMTVAADVYGLGAILYEILTGQPPYVGGDSLRILESVRAGPPRRPSAIACVPPALEAICIRAMERDPSKRYPDATAVASDVQHWLADEPIDVYREPFGARLQRWVRRHPALTAAACALTITTLIGIGISRELITHEQTLNAEDRARLALEQADAAAKSEAELQRQLYFNRIALAQGMLADHNHSGAKQLLTECPLHLRGWEWLCLARLCRDDAVTLRGHDSTVVSVALSPDGRTLVSAGFDGGVRNWDLTTGRLRYTYRKHKTIAYHLAFSPDGTHVASTGWDGTVRIWESATGQTRRILSGMGNHVNRVAYLPDGQHVMTLDSDKSVRLWNLLDGSTQWQLDGENEASWHLMTLVVSPNGRYAAVAGGFSPIRLIDLDSGVVVKRMSGQRGQVRALAFSRDSRFLASGDGDVGRCDAGEVRVWDLEDGQMVRVFRGHTGPIFALDFNSDGTRLASASQDRTVRLWDLTTGQQALMLQGHSDVVRCVLFNRDCSRMVTAGADHSIRIWDAAPQTDEPPQRLVENFKDPDGIVYAVAYDPKGKRLASIGEGRTVRFFADGKPDGTSLEMKPDVDYFSLVYSPDGVDLALAQSGGRILILDSKSARIKREWLGHDGGPIKGIAYSPDGERLATASWDRTVKVWNPTTGERLHVLEGHREAVNSVAFSHDGLQIATACNDRTVRIWDSLTGKCLHVLPHPNCAPTAVWYSASQPLVATGGADGLVRVWDIGTWKLKLKFRGHIGAVYALTFSPDGNYLATTGQDCTVKIWRPDRDEPLITLRGHTERIHGMAFHPIERRLATAAYDGWVKVWDVSIPSY